MKKSLIALAVLAAAGSASAQSSVTLFGIVDAAVQWGQGKGTGASDKIQLGNSGLASSRLGFRGTEDLGAGLSASFWLEAGHNNDNGTGAGTNLNNQASGSGATAAGTQGLMFNRKSTVSLAGGWGELRLGRDYTPQFFNLTAFDPFGTNGVGTTQTLVSIITGVTAVRASNSIGYLLPGNIGGFYGQFQHYRGENNQNGAANEDDGTGNGLRIGFASGPFDIALAVSRTEYAAGDVKQNNLGGSFNFGVGTLMAHVSKDSNGSTDGKGFLVGGLFPMGPGLIRAAYSEYKVDVAGDPKTKKIALGYVHNLSKRTALYTTFAHVKNSGGAASALNGSVTAANNKSSGLDVGLRHSF